MAMSIENQTAINAAMATLVANLSSTNSSPIDVSKLTEVDLNGTGVFDKLMATCSLLAEAEFDAGRIRGADYSAFYLGMVQTALGNATQFLLAWDKAALEKANILAQIQVGLNQADDVLAATALKNKQIEDIAAGVKIKYQQELAEKIKNGNVAISHTYDVDGNVLTTTYGVGTSKSLYESQIDLTDSQTLTQDKQANLIVQQANLIVQKTVTEMAEVNTTIPTAVTGAADLSSIVPLAPAKIAGAKGANRDVTLEQRAGYMRKAQNDLIKVATGHVDMLVSSGAATNVGDYTADLLKLLRDPENATGEFGSSSLLFKAVNDVASLSPAGADSV